MTRFPVFAQIDASIVPLFINSIRERDGEFFYKSRKATWITPRLNIPAFGLFSIIEEYNKLIRNEKINQDFPATMDFL